MLNAFTSWDLPSQKELAVLVSKVAKEVIFLAQIKSHQKSDIGLFFVFGTVTEVSPADSCNWALTSVAEGWLEDRVIKQSSNFPVNTLGLWSSIMIILTSLRKYENKFFSQGGCLVHILVQYDYEVPQ